MNMQIEITNRASKALLELGITSDAADKAILLLGADGAECAALEQRVGYLAALCRACGNLQNAKLAYSLAGRSGHQLDDENCALLAQALKCSECVPAAVRLWKKALEAGVADPAYLVAAARLGEDGMEQIRVLNSLKADPGKLAAVGELARRLRAHGWECEGSWGAVSDPERGLVWWDHAVPSERRAYGMTLTTRPISLRNKLNVVLAFEERHEILGTTDRCHLEVSVDGKRWEKLLKFEGTSDWTSQEVDLSRFSEEEITLRFHVLSGGQREGRGVELANLRLESVSVTRQQKVDFGQLPAGWDADGPQSRSNPTLVGSQSESAVQSEKFGVNRLTAPTLSLEARLQASSVYAEATIEVLSGQDSVLVKESLTPSSDWVKLNLLLPNTKSEDLRLRLWSRFAKRKDADGLWVRNPRLRAGTEDSRESVALDGGFEDGLQEQKALLKLVETGDLDRLKRLLSLREGLPSLKSALALSALLRSEEHIPALLLLFSRMKEGAVEAFGML
ncbi:MAG: hypothetical protein KC800_33515, partial [Candidatus Eremiobacteraeota bacterium]|nr:hypothetical protein [Candidatus Eremiobacteraeota bacterium]